jgi:hypothetical protein
MRFPQIEGVTFEENPERLKIVLPVHRNWLLVSLFTICLIAWVATLFIVVQFLIRDVLSVGGRFAFLMSIMLLVWGVIYYYLGRMLWQRWQYVTANREIIFIYKDDQVIVRRPLSLLGITTAYDFEHVSPFYYDDKRQSLAFKYGQRLAHFGHSLSTAEAQQILDYVNYRFFPEEEDE